MKLKDKKIEMLAVQSVINENGYPEEKLAPICTPVWAYFRRLSGKEYYAANAEQVQEEALFQINWRAGLSTAYVIRFNGVLWDITRVDTFEGYKADVSIILQMANMTNRGQNITKTGYIIALKLNAVL